MNKQFTIMKGETGYLACSVLQGAPVPDVLQWGFTTLDELLAFLRAELMVREAPRVVPINAAAGDAA